METTMKRPRPAPRWVQWFLNLTWYEWIGWIVEVGLIAMFAAVAYGGFQEYARTGWVMFGILFWICAPGLWILLKYRPEGKSLFEKTDIGLLIAFILWIIFMILMLAWTPEYGPGPFGSPNL